MSESIKPIGNELIEKISTIAALEKLGSPGADILGLIERQEFNGSEASGLIPAVPILKMVSSVWYHDAADFSDLVHAAFLGLPDSSPRDVLVAKILVADERESSRPPVCMAATLRLGGILENENNTEESDKNLGTSPGQVDEATAFAKEFARFVIAKQNLRHFMPSPDRFPLFCALLDEAKKSYAATPRLQRTSQKFIPFSYFGRDWRLGAEYEYFGGREEIYLVLCAASGYKCVTVAVDIDDSREWFPGNDGAA